LGQTLRTTPQVTILDFTSKYQKPKNSVCAHSIGGAERQCHICSYPPVLQCPGWGRHSVIWLRYYTAWAQYRTLKLPSQSKKKSARRKPVRKPLDNLDENPSSSIGVLIQGMILERENILKIFWSSGTWSQSGYMEEGKKIKPTQVLHGRGIQGY
jgi:hypothetical protein